MPVAAVPRENAQEFPAPDAHPPLVSLPRACAFPRYIQGSIAALARSLNGGKSVWDVAAVVLAGGASSRMGRPKALVPFLGEPLVARMLRRLRAQADAVYLNARGEDEPRGSARR